LLEFLFAIPREQLVRPGQRRSLMRRALAGIVPNEILNRRRKAYVSRTPLSALAAQCPTLGSSNQQMLTGVLGIADPLAFSEALKRVRDGRESRIVQLLRIIEVEAWLQQLVARRVITLAALESKPTQFARQLNAHRDSAQPGRMLDNLNVNGG
jgi:asparagine synthase (glutamine-hydrolysing)